MFTTPFPWQFHLGTTAGRGIYRNTIFLIGFLGTSSLPEIHVSWPSGCIGVAVNSKSPVCPAILKDAKGPNNNVDLSSYSQFVVEKSVQPCGFRIAAVTCFAEIRTI